MLRAQDMKPVALVAEPRNGETHKVARLLNVVDVAVALPALIMAMTVWGVLSSTGHL